MKLKRICKVDYDDKDVVIIPQCERLMYDVYFIDNEDWLCIDEDDYTPAKVKCRVLERQKKYFVKNNEAYKSQYLQKPIK